MKDTPKQLGVGNSGFNLKQKVRDVSRIAMLYRGRSDELRDPTR